MIDTLIDTLIDWMIHWLIDWLINWSIDTLIDWWIDRSIDSVIYWFIDWLSRSFCEAELGFAEPSYPELSRHTVSVCKQWCGNMHTCSGSRWSIQRSSAESHRSDAVSEPNSGQLRMGFVSWWKGTEQRVWIQKSLLQIWIKSIKSHWTPSCYGWPQHQDVLWKLI